jgi:hypothetical protein
LRTPPSPSGSVALRAVRSCSRREEARWRDDASCAHGPTRTPILWSDLEASTTSLLWARRPVVDTFSGAGVPNVSTAIPFRRCAFVCTRPRRETARGHDVRSRNRNALGAGDQVADWRAGSVGTDRLPAVVMCAIGSVRRLQLDVFVRRVGSIARASGSLASDGRGRHRRIRSNPVRGIAVSRWRPAGAQKPDVRRRARTSERMRCENRRGLKLCPLRGVISLRTVAFEVLQRPGSARAAGAEPGVARTAT